jgi:hypothetical protein
MIPFANFEFSQQSHARRQRMLSEVMPLGDDFTYFILLSDAYLIFHEGERHIFSFDELHEALGSRDDLQALQTVRAEGQLTEGRHALPEAVACCLADAGSGPSQVRRWVFGESEPIISTVALSEVKNVWAGLDFEEVEVGDPSGKWYFRARDDDPLIFLAVKGASLRDHIRRCKEFCREVPEDFIYVL